MQKLIFQGIGTHWKVLYFVPEEIDDVSSWKSSLERKILQTVELFDQRYSRFRKDSLVWQLALSTKKQHKISDEFADILSFGFKLKELTKGRFNPAVGFVLESLGYDSEYSFQEKTISQKISLEWKLENLKLHTPNPVLFDIGAWGKGYLIDMVAAVLESEGVKHYLVDGGGDVRGTSKPDNTPWKVPLVHPLKEQQAFAVVELKNFALACTGSTLRAFGNYHHLVDPYSYQSVKDVLGVYTQALTATQADGAATALFVDELENTQDLANKLSVEYLLVTPALKFGKSTNFTGQIFGN